MKKLSILGEITPAQFLRDYWQKKPLLIRQAMPGFKPVMSLAALAALAAQDDVEARLVTQTGGQWAMSQGPLADLPPPAEKGWTLLVQGANLHHAGADAVLRQFRFLPDARLDDLMISYATDTGGVGPHYDSYDVFLLQAQGRRHWRIGRQKDLSLVPDMPVKILANFVAEQEFVLEPGDMLYLPPDWAHDGIAEGDCMTYSIGFRSPVKGEIARDLLQALAEQAEDDVGCAIYRDPKQPAVSGSGEIPEGLVKFAQEALAAALKDPLALQRSLGEIMTEPKAHVWFHGEQEFEHGVGVRLDKRTRMMYDAKHVFINGESFRAAGSDAKRMRKLADSRELTVSEVAKLSEDARALLMQWGEDGWLYGLH